MGDLGLLEPESTFLIATLVVLCFFVYNRSALKETCYYKLLSSCMLLSRLIVWFDKF